MCAASRAITCLQEVLDWPESASVAGYVVEHVEKSYNAILVPDGLANGIRWVRHKARVSTVCLWGVWGSVQLICQTPRRISPFLKSQLISCRRKFSSHLAKASWLLCCAWTGTSSQSVPGEARSSGIKPWALHVLAFSASGKGGFFVAEVQACRSEHPC